MAFRFGDFALDLDRYELTRRGEPLEAEPQVLEVLAFLVERRHRLVTKEELLDAVWEGRHVSDSAISRAVREARRLLGDTAAESRWVRTVYGRGFRFAGAVEEDGAAGREPEAEPTGGGPRDEPAASPATSEPRPRPLPAALTRLVGRERELGEVAELLAASRLVTLTGAAGAGKSRLAVAVATAVQERFADGAALVPLGEVVAAPGVAPAIARALGLTDAAGDSTLASLALQLRDRRLLLVLDDFEHLLAAAPQVVELLTACPGLVVLVTSRFVLGVAGEQEYPLPPLALPPQDADAAALREAPSVAMFLARARAGRPSFRPGERDLRYVAEICRRLDGLPLALELAAARVKLFEPAELWERLAGRLDLLSSPRRGRAAPGRSLEEALAWSHDLLEDEEKALFGRLAVFAGSFDLDAVGAVCGGAGPADAELLAALVDKSLVERVERGGGRGDRPPGSTGVRFRLLDTTRAFALARLSEAGEEGALRDGHAEWFADVARRGGAALAGGDQRRWLDRLDAEYPNLLAALEWSREGGELGVGLALGAALGRYWSARGAYREGAAELAALLDHPDVAAADPARRTDALMARALLTHLLCDYRRARELLAEALAAARDADDRRRAAEALGHLAWIATQIDPLDEAEPLARKALRVAEEVGEPRGVAVALNDLGHLAFYRGDAARSEQLLADSLVWRRRAGDERGVAFALANLAMVRLMLGGDPQPVEGWLAEARSTIRHLGDRPVEGWICCLEARAALVEGAPRRALELLEESGYDDPRLSHPDGRAWLELTSGDARLALGDRPAARDAFGRAAATWRALGAPWGEATATLRLAGLAATEADAAEARDRYRHALGLAERFGLTATAERCRRDLAARH